MEKEQDSVQRQTNKRIYYFERLSDGKIIDVDEATASTKMYHTNPKNQLQPLKYLGSSDGSHYHRIFKEARGIENGIISEIEKKKEDLLRYGKTFDKLKYEDLLDEDDPKMVKAQTIIDTLKEELNELHAKRNKIRNEVATKAMEEELKHVDPNDKPRNFQMKSENGQYDFEGRTLQGFNGIDLSI